MRKLIERAERIGARAQRRTFERLAHSWSGAEVRTEGDRLVVEGRRLVRRWLAEPLLRFAARL